MEAQGKDTYPPLPRPVRIEQAEQDLAAARKGGDLQGEALALESLGFDYLLASETAKGFQAAREALHAWRKFGNGRGAAHALTLMALCIKSMQGARETLPIQRRAAAIGRHQADLDCREAHPSPRDVPSQNGGY